MNCKMGQYSWVILSVVAVPISTRNAGSALGSLNVDVEIVVGRKTVVDHPTTQRNSSEWDVFMEDFSGEMRWEQTCYGDRRDCIVRSTIWSA